MVSTARSFARSYAGRYFEVEGGTLDGSIHLGGGAPPTVRLSRDGAPMLDAARHDMAQCQIVLSEAGQVGCSWTDEFHLLFDSVENFIEDCALWREHYGWWYAATLIDDPARIHTLLGGVRRRSFSSAAGSSGCSAVTSPSRPTLSPTSPSPDRRACP
ncbi:hypothetical protein NKG05_03830 [Oerskovia sp. M15]